MSKPLWRDSPSWARYLAMNEWGIWFWFENKPTYGKLGLLFNGLYHRAFPADWRDTLEERPVHKSSEA